MRGAAKCRNCLQVGSICKDGEEISASEAPGVLRAGLVVARREPGKSTICGFPCTAEFLFPMPGNLGQAEVVSFTKGQDHSMKTFSVGATQQEQQGLAPGFSFGAPPRP